MKLKDYKWDVCRTCKAQYPVGLDDSANEANEVMIECEVCGDVNWSEDHESEDDLDITLGFPRSKG